MNSDEMLRSRQLLIILLVSVSSDSLSAVFARAATFNKVIGPDPGMGTLAAAWPESDKMKCALACLQRYGLCHAFTYNETSRLCTLGHSVASTSPYLLQSPQGSLYASTACDVNSGFGLYSRANVTTCLWISTVRTNFSTAEQSCNDRGGNLVTLQTQEKLDIFLNIAVAMNKNIWIGLDDRLVEDEMRWHNDGSIMTNAQRADIFVPGQPDNYGNEDCMRFALGGKRINDDKCSRSFLCICETEPAVS